MHYGERMVSKWTARLEAKKIAVAQGRESPRTEAVLRKKTVHLDPDDDRCQSEKEIETRMAIKLVWRQLEKPLEEAWDGRDGHVAEIRRRLGLAESQRNTIRRTLKLCIADADLSEITHRGGVKRKLSDHDERVVADLLVSGFGQQQARQQINMVRAKRGENLVGKDCILAIIDHGGAVVPSLNKCTGRRYEPAAAPKMHSHAMSAHAERMAKYEGDF
mmetsp:Transcript_45181/g.118587  ORF Transcript_45181/g.118587 Transcript_45181/m.118587 type:complete len:218 (-) Transcript_45181:9-662(-)